MGYVIFEYGMSIADTLINILFLEKIFGYKEGKKNNRYVFMLLYFIAAQYLMAYLVPQMFCVILIEVVYCIASLDGKKYEHIIWTIVLNVIYCAISSVALPILAIATAVPAAELAVAGSVTRIWAALIQKFLICAFLWVILTYKSKQFNLSFTEKVIVATLLVANIFIVSGFYVIVVKSSMEFKTQLGLFAISLLIVVVLIACAVLIVKINAKNKQMLENHMLRFQLENQGDMIDNMRRNNEEVKVLRHDLKHYAAIILSLLNNGNMEEAVIRLKKYIEKTVQAEQKTDYVKGNPSINAVLYNCVCECDDKEIYCDIEVITRYPQSIEQDIAIVFANLLDNAIRAEEGVITDKRKILVSIYEEDDVIIAVINNYIEKSVLSHNPELKTSKKDKDIHGWGMKSVKNIVEKCSGMINIFEEDNSFNIVIKIPKV